LPRLVQQPLLVPLLVLVMGLGLLLLGPVLGLVLMLVLLELVLVLDPVLGPGCVLKLVPLQVPMLVQMPSRVLLLVVPMAGMLRLMPILLLLPGSVEALLWRGPLQPTSTPARPSSLRARTVRCCSYDWPQPRIFCLKGLRPLPPSPQLPPTRRALELLL